MSQSDSPSGDDEYRIEGARVVGKEYDVFLAIMTEYRVRVTAGPVEDDAIEIAEELALHGREDTMTDRFLAHTEVEEIRDVFEDDVEAGKIDWMDEPTSPSEETFWDDSQHFPDHYETTGDSEVNETDD